MAPRKRPDDLILIGLFKSNLTIYEICKRLGLSECVVYAHKRRLGFKSKIIEKRKYNLALKSKFKEIKKVYEETKSSIETAKVFNTTGLTILKILKENNYEILPRGTAKAWILDKNFLIEEYSNKKRTTVDIAKELNCSSNHILTYLKKYKIPLLHTPTFKVNHNFFSTWSDDMAYILGFITADGYIGKTRPYLVIDLNPKDDCVLKYIRDLVSPNNTIRYRTDKAGHKHAILTIYSKQIVEDLARYSVVNRKSKTIRCNFDIPEKYFWHYLRGVFDGDGCVYLHHKKWINSSIYSGNKEFLEDLQSKIKFGRINKSGGCFQLNFNQTYSFILREKLYSDNKFCLERKRIKFYAN